VAALTHFPTSNSVAPVIILPHRMNLCSLCSVQWSV